MLFGESRSTVSDGRMDGDGVRVRGDKQGLATWATDWGGLLESPIAALPKQQASDASGPDRMSRR
jgi:hypothetical protein